MNKTHGQLLAATLVGLIIAGAAAYADGPALAEDSPAGLLAQVTGVSSSELLNVRMAPGGDAWTVGTLEPGANVWVDRCTLQPTDAAAWCLVESGETHGWVNARFLSLSRAI
jgi:uncharacterized protein YraI